MNIVRSKYGGYEGPMFPGTVRVEVSTTADPIHKIVAVTTATEGGCYDSMNGYDRCVLSLGAIQFCGAIGLLFPLMNKILDALPEEPKKLLSEWESRYKVSFLPSLLNPGNNLSSILYGCSGREGSWSSENWTRANELFRALQPVLAHPQAQKAQLDHTASRILSFVMRDTARTVFPENLADNGWLGVLQAAVVSFSANLPAVANRHFMRYVDAHGPPKPTREYVEGAIDAMTFGPNIAIYPHRKKAILPELSRLYGVTFSSTEAPVPDRAPAPMSTKQVQEKLISLGYDLGPAGADGILGRKTLDAIRQFQKKSGLVPDGIVGPKTSEALAKAGT